MTTKHIQHLYWRAGFGLNPKEVKQHSLKSKDQIIDELFLNSKNIEPLTIDLSPFNIYTYNYLKDNKDRRIAYNKLNRETTNKYSLKWFERLNTTNSDLRERMTLFWANHFVVRDKVTAYISNYNNTLRKYALGDFRVLTKEVTKQASMIKYLNLNQNKKQSPNENFSRELLELFTLGEGNYTEKDIKECARSFTGYKHNHNGGFVFNKGAHDFGEKTFLGEKGDFDGDKIIDIILSQKQCANHICRKIYEYFVNKNVNSKHLEEMTNVFFKDYNIENLMRHVFSSTWFYESNNIGTKIKSPIDLLIGINKIVPIRFRNDKELFRVQTLLDQILLDPPNVAGWEGGKSWITTNSLMIRIKLPSMILEKETYTFQTRGSLKAKNVRIVSVKNKFQEKLDVSINWRAYRKNVKKVTLNELKDTLILCEINPGIERYISTFGRRPKKKNLVKLMSLPEYQMC
ncbi:DUF1800 domain-containing protein [Lacinutrix salivirga]